MQQRPNQSIFKHILWLFRVFWAYRSIGCWKQINLPQLASILRKIFRRNDVRLIWICPYIGEKFSMAYCLLVAYCPLILDMPQIRPDSVMPLNTLNFIVFVQTRRFCIKCVLYAKYFPKDASQLRKIDLFPAPC